ncbi:MAG: hypothetical protein L0241_20710 [Planctomycetia bacterium]|nr:hypothetical protein [Planctomycetia bacterium]
MTHHAKWSLALVAITIAGEVALQSAVTTDWSQKQAQALLFAFLIGPPLFLALTVWRRRAHPSRSRLLFWLAVAVAVGGLGVLGFNVHRYHTDPEFRRSPNMYGLIVPLVQWVAIVGLWLWLVIQEGQEKRAAKQSQAK